MPKYKPYLLWPIFFGVLFAIPPALLFYSGACGNGSDWQIILCMIYDALSVHMHDPYSQFSGADWFLMKPLSWGLWGILFGILFARIRQQKTRK
jgi:hypothetical protein